MPLPSFEAIAALEPKEQRRFLLEGDSQERVWAAWALALRVGHPELPAIREQTFRAPDTGVRRHLVVVIAGLGDVDLVQILAGGDPEPRVRATACQYLIQSAPKRNSLVGFLEERLISDEAAVVRHQIIEYSRRYAVPLSQKLLLALLNDTETEVRLAALESVIAAAADSTVAAVCRTAVSDDAARLRERAMSWCVEQGHVDLLLRELENEAPERWPLVLEPLAELGVRASWEVLKGFGTVDAPTVDLVVSRILESPPSEDAFWWYVRGVARAARSARATLIETRFGYFAHAQLAHLLTENGNFGAAACKIDDLNAAIRHLEQDVKQLQRAIELGEFEGDDLDWDYEEEVASRMALLESLAAHSLLLRRGESDQL